MNRRSFIKHGIGSAAATLGPLHAGLAQNATTPPASKFDLKGQVQKSDVPPPPPPRSPSGAFNVSDRAQLFVDRVVVDSTDGIAFTLHQGKKHHLNPMIRADRPWESWRVNLYGSAMFDEQENIFKLWYIGDKCDSYPDFATLYATSKDGFNWEKPLIGPIKSHIGEQTNAVIDCVDVPSIFKDVHEPDPARRYKGLLWDHRSRTPDGGVHGGYSPDGIHWTRFTKERLFASNDVMTAFWHHERKLWVAYPKVNVMIRGIRRRCFNVTTSADMKTWTPLKLALTPDLRDDAIALARVESARPLLDVPDDPALVRAEYYGNGFYQAESCLLAFHWMLFVNNYARYGNHEGPGELALGVSRDLETWEKPFRTPVLPRSAPGEWDSGFLTTSVQAFRYKDEIRFYYAGANYTHGTPAVYREVGTGRSTKYMNRIGLATWKLDRFVSADGSSDGGRLTTVPVHFEGKRLELNVNAQGGRVRVEPLDVGGRPLAGFGLSDPISTDQIRQTVTWKGRSDLSALPKPVVLRFHLEKAHLFSFAFRA